MWEEEEKTSEWEDSTWNFNSNYYKRKQEAAAEQRRAYYERQERIKNYPPDEDDWNK